MLKLILTRVKPLKDVASGAIHGIKIKKVDLSKYSW